MKQCSHCGKVKPVSEFYPSRKTPDGLRYSCKSCHIESVIRTRDPEKHRISERLSMRRCRKRDPWKFRRRERLASRKRPHDLRYRARIELNKAVASGTVKKPARCTGCGQKGHLHGHHPDYNRPLRVKWFCPVCHAAEHRRMKVCPKESRN
jgi:hypothetical protein